MGMGFSCITETKLVRPALHEKKFRLTDSPLAKEYDECLRACLQKLV
jgi:hypothetical protein